MQKHNSSENLKKGTTINYKNISSMRPAIGISPLYIDKIIGKIKLFKK